MGKINRSAVDGIPVVFVVVILLVFGLIFSFIGLYFVYSDYSVISSWKAWKGDVIYSKVKEGTKDGSLVFFADIAYNYTYNGKQYTDHCCTLSTSDYSVANKIVEKNKVGGMADIFVNPEDPTKSRLKEDVNPFDLFYLVFVGIGMIAFLIAGMTIIFPNLIKSA